MVNVHRAGIKAPLKKVYDALSTVEGISGWWTEQTSGVAEVGKTIVARFFPLKERKLAA